MKGSTSMMGTPQSSYGQQGGPSAPAAPSARNYAVQAFMSHFSPRVYQAMSQRNAGSGKGSQPVQTQASAPQMPEYVNYQQMPNYSSQPVAPSQSILDFMGNGYASGGAAKERTLDDEIEMALRIVRLLGELKKS